MSTPKFIDPEDLTLYAMHLLGPGEAAAVEAHLEQNAASRRELADIRADLGLFALTAEAVVPSAQARTRFLKQVGEEKRGTGSRPVLQNRFDQPGPPDQVTSIDSARTTPVRRGFAERSLPWAGWAVAAGLAFTAGQLYHERQGLRQAVIDNQSVVAKNAADATTAREVLSALNDQTAMRVTLTKAGVPPSPTGRTTYSAEKGVLIFTASNLEPVATFKVYELWLIPANGSAPIPAGTFHPDPKGAANLVMTDMPKGVEAKAFGITVEDDGGAKIPTPPILMTGA